MTANGGPYFGETIGRYGNRIAKGTFTLNQPGVGPVTYTVPINNGVNSLHGGLVGFGNHIWAVNASTTPAKSACSSRWSAPTATRAARPEAPAARTAAPATRPRSRWSSPSP